MIKQLRKRICVVLSAVLILILAAIELYLYWESYTYNKQSEQLFLKEIAVQVQREQAQSEQTQPEQTQPGKTRPEQTWSGQEWILYEGLPVSVFIDTQGELRQIFGGGGAETGREAVLQQAQTILELDQTEGKYGSFRYLYQDSILVLYDESDWEEYNRGLIQGLAVSFLLFAGVIVGISLLLSRWLTRPAQKAFEQQKQFVSDASHELKTPLAVIGANAQRLQKEMGDNQWLGYILSEYQRMGKLLEELLTLARMERPSVEGEQKKFDLSRALTGTLLPYESDAFELGVHFYMDLEEECFVMGEEEHLKQAAVILVDNALHHVSAGGNVWVRLSHRKDRAILEVANTGPEIPEEERVRIFQRFYQSDKTKGRKENRHGLGLAIAAAVAQRHKGRIWVDCRDGITTFYLMI